jgi:serine/threonine protein kinase
LKILDFGLARIETPGLDAPKIFATRQGAVLGTPAYMAPEQLNGQPADARADVFAFGITTYEFACGEHPFAAPTELGLVARLLESRAQPLAARRPQMPLPLAAVIDRCLAKAPGDRFASASEIAAALANGASPRATPGVSIWWRTHQLTLMAVYILASTIAWQIKESYWSPASLWLFVAIGIGGAVSGIIRGHLVFTEQMNRPRLADERRRTATIVTAVDLLIALALIADALTFVEVRPLWGMLTMALGLGIAMAALVMEPATTAAAFGSD